MKKIIFTLAALTFFSCQEEKKKENNTSTYTEPKDQVEVEQLASDFKFTEGPGSGMVDPFATSDPLPNGAEVIGDIHTHGADNNSPRINNNTGKKEYDADSVITEDGDYNKADDMSSAIETYISSYVVGPNGTISVYSPNGAEGEERYNQTRKVSTDVAPSDPDSRTGKNEISPNLTPVVLPQGLEKDDFPKK